MLWEKHKPTTPWYPTDQIIDKWLHERQELLGLFYKILKIEPFEEEGSNEELVRELLSEFCQILIDYISLGHFEVFEKITEADKHHMLDTSMIAGISLATLPAIDFSNKYAQADISLANLQKDLNKLGEQLAQRLDLEDKLIEIYVQATSG